MRFHNNINNNVLLYDWRVPIIVMSDCDTHTSYNTRTHTLVAVGTFNRTQAIEYCLTVNNVLLLDSPFGKNDIK